MMKLLANRYYYEKEDEVYDLIDVWRNSPKQVYYKDTVNPNKIYFVDMFNNLAVKVGSQMPTIAETTWNLLNTKVVKVSKDDTLGDKIYSIHDILDTKTHLITKEEAIELSDCYLVNEEDSIPVIYIVIDKTNPTLYRFNSNATLTKCHMYHTLLNGKFKIATEKDVQAFKKEFKDVEDRKSVV